MSKQYVQHVSGQGEKWQLDDQSAGMDNRQDWRVLAKDHSFYHLLPKSEYRLCEPPEQWMDVTERVEVRQWNSTDFSLPQYAGLNGELYLYCDGDRVEACSKSYRLVKTAGGFRVEKKAE